MTGYRRPVSDADRAAAAEAREATLDKLHAQLSDGVLALNDPQAWQTWLRFASRFHKYSFGNSLLIMAQDPHATHVAGYQAFKAMGRQVRRGETASMSSPRSPAANPASTKPDAPSATRADAPSTEPTWSRQNP